MIVTRWLETDAISRSACASAIADLLDALPDATDAHGRAAVMATREARTTLLAAGPSSYLAIQGYLAPTPEFDGEVAELRALIRDRTTMATTFGYGPRYLHSTGQLHKGGKPDGRFLQLVHVSDDDGLIAGPRAAITNPRGP